MGSQGFRSIPNNLYVYQGMTGSSSSAIGWDALANTFKISVSTAEGALPSVGGQLVIDPAVAGNITITPNGAGLFIVGSTSYPKVTAKGDVLVASADNTIGVVAGATTAGHVLTANGAGSAPTFQAAPAGVTYASDAETLAGTVTNKAVAPSNLKAKLGLQTVHALPVGNSDTLALDWLAVGGDGTVLIGNTGADPSFSANPTVSTIYATTFDTNVATAAVTLAGTTLAADGTDADININITAKGAGKVIIDDLQLTTDLAVTEGGTGQSTLTAHGVLLGEGTSGIGATTAGTAGQILTSSGAASDPVWTTATYPATAAIGDVLVASAANTIGVVTGAATAGHVLMANGAGSAPTFQALPASGIVTLAGGTGTATGTTVTIAGGTGITTAATGSTLTVTNSLPMNIPNYYSSANYAMAIGYNALASSAARGTNSVVFGDNACAGLVGGSDIRHSTLIGRNVGLTLGNYAAGSFDYNDLYGYNVASSNDLHQNNFKYNCMFGSLSASKISSTDFLYNSFFGYNTGGALNNNQYTTSNNTFIGANAGATMTYGNGISYNTFIGSGSGNAYPAAANTGSCICIGYNASGSATETNILRIGNATGTSAGNLNASYICGIYGRTPAGTLNVALIDSNNQLGSVASLGVAQGGTGVATLTDHSVLLGSGTGAITPLGEASNGQIPIGSTGADPVLAAITAGTGISVTNGAGSITIASTVSALAWSEITDATKTIVNQEAYVANRGTQIVFTLPASAALGTEFKIQGKGAGLWKIAQGAGQQIYLGSVASTSGAGGYLEATDAHDAITLVCITADTVWAAEAVIGNITVA